MNVAPALFSAIFALLLLVRPASGQSLVLLAAFDNNGAGGAPSVNWRGGSQISGYEGWTILDTATFGAFAGATFNVGQGYALETPQLAELLLTKEFDETTPRLLSNLGVNHDIAKIEIQLVSLSEQGQARIIARYVLGQARLVRQEHVARADAVVRYFQFYNYGGVPVYFYLTVPGETTEHVSIYYRSLAITHFAYNPTTGQPDPAKNVTRSYDQTNP